MKKIKINAGDEMRGAGLRRTYLNLAIDSSKFKIEQMKKKNKLRKIRKKVLVASTCTFSIVAIVFCTHAVYANIKPSFGDTMKCVSSKNFAFDNLSKFINTVFYEVKTKNSSGEFSFWSRRIPPELQAVWGASLSKIKDASSLDINKILVDPDRKGVYHVKCEADSPHSGTLGFRMQCAEVNGKYILLALQ